METPTEQGDRYVAEAMERLGCRFPESVFYRAALEAGYTRDAEDRAKALYELKRTAGLAALPEWTIKALERYIGHSIPRERPRRIPIQ